MENQNSVCYVGEVTEVKSIEGADKIELVIVGGWNCIVPKGEYSENERVIIATTDAVIPESIVEQMGVASYLRKGNRVRTVKLKGVYSECLIIPTKYAKNIILSIGEDKMGELSISKYEPPVRQIQLSSGQKKNYRDNPNFPIYYKFPNLKNVMGMFTEEDQVQITRKLHGTNARYGIVKKTSLTFFDKVKKFFRLADRWIDYEFVYGSHNCEKGSDTQGYYSTDVWRTIADDYQIKEKLWSYVKRFSFPGELGTGVILYGEIYGTGIQKNYDYNCTGMAFAGFDLIEDGKYVDTLNTKLAISSMIGLPHIEILYIGEWSQEIQDKYTFNNFISGTKVPHEGIVIKHTSGDRRKVSKVINPGYSIYSEKHEVGDSH